MTVVHIISYVLAYIAGVHAVEAQQCTDPASCEEDTIKAIVDDHDIIPATFKKHLESVEKYELHEMLESLKEIAAEICEDVGVTTLMQRHVERLLIADQFPPSQTVEEDDGEGYATFGSLLDISTEYSASWNGSTEFGGKVSWIGSMFWRKAIIKHENKQPCKTDLSDDYDGSSDSCIHGVTINNYVSVRGNLDKKHEHMELAASWEILGGDQAQWRSGKIMDLDFGRQKFDTIVCNGMLAGTELELQDLDLILKKVTSLLKPGGIIFVIGTEPSRRVNGPENVVNEISDVINSAKILMGESLTHNIPATWINRNLDSLGLNVFSSTLFPAKASYDDIEVTVNDAMEWIDEEFEEDAAIKGHYMQMLEKYLHVAEGVVSRGPVYSGENQYIIAAKLPLNGEKKENKALIKPTTYQPMKKKSK